MNAPWYNVERVSQPGSSILTAWKAGREAARSSPKAAGTPLSEIVPGSDIYEILTGGYSLGGAGMPVTEQTTMTIGAVYACVSLIGGALAALPFHLYKRTDKGRERYDSDMWWLFNESPYGAWTAAAAWQHAAQSIALKGDAFWQIHRGSNARMNSAAILGLEPHHPDRVDPILSSGRLFYRVQTVQGQMLTIDQEDMLHFTGIGFDGRRSITPIRAALRPAAGIALAADEYAGAFFKNGARPDFAIKAPGKVSEEQATLLRNTWGSRHAGPSNAHLPAILSGGLDVEKLSLSAEDAQLLSTRKFQVEDIARIFGVPPHMIGYTEKSSSWGTGVEQMSIGFVRYTLRRYIDAIQQEINRKIWPRSRLFFGEFLVDALLEGDSKTQAELFAKALGGPGTQGYMAVNEVRRLKNLPPMDGFDDVIRSGAQPAGAATADPQTTEDSNASSTDQAAGQ